MKKAYSQHISRIPFTKEGYKEVFAQKAALLAQRPEAVENLRKGREMGDLSENGYYKEARARLSFIDARLRRLTRLIRFGVVVEAPLSGIVGIGSKVRVSCDKQQFTYTIVGGYESDPRKGTISHHSPIGKALMGHQVGDAVMVEIPVGEKQYLIEEIT